MRRKKAKQRKQPEPHPVLQFKLSQQAPEHNPRPSYAEQADKAHAVKRRFPARAKPHAELCNHRRNQPPQRRLEINRLQICRRRRQKEPVLQKIIRMHDKVVVVILSHVSPRPEHIPQVEQKRRCQNAVRRRYAGTAPKYATAAPIAPLCRKTICC